MERRNGEEFDVKTTRDFFVRSILLLFCEKIEKMRNDVSVEERNADERHFLRYDTELANSLISDRI